MLNTKDVILSKIASGNPCDCWPWTGGRNSTGYGSVRFGGKQMLAHRLAYLFANDELPSDLHVCHRCDNRSCCNPNHLFLGTDKDNNRDMWIKGRQPLSTRGGVLNGNSKLSHDDVDSIKKAYALGCITHRELAEKYNVTDAHIGKIIRGKLWKLENA